jgi:hypothetical protein
MSVSIIRLLIKVVMGHQGSLSLKILRTYLYGRRDKPCGDIPEPTAYDE